MKIIRTIHLIIPVMLFILSCEDNLTKDANFSYQGILDKEFRFSVGRVIPVTIGQAIETDGDISRDGQYFFYSSNTDGGNYDIYLRSMTDITTVRLTSHPSRDITPAISPDGKKLAFVSFRDDPEGDIFMMKIKPAELIKKEEESIISKTLFKNDAENITLKKDETTDAVINIKDANPSWSPDSRWIAYSSSDGGIQNIWIMRYDGSNKRKITEKGGQYPSFSTDGKKIVFVSYRDNENGDIYIFDITGGRVSRITSDKNIKLYPSFMNTTDRIIYSSIENDTNKNGQLDLQDRSLIRFIDTGSNLTYPLTTKSDSSFKARWLPVFSSRDYNGIIIYTDITGENINLNIIPETGIIPKKLNARNQYDLCGTYLDEYDDTEKYLLSLESVYHHYRNNADNSAKAYVNRALEEAAFYYRRNGIESEAGRIISLIRKRAEGKDLYAAFIINMIEKPGEWRNETDIPLILKKYGTDSNSLYFIPFILEDIADSYYRKNDYASALKFLNYISVNYSGFERSSDILTKISLCSDDLRKGVISDAAVKVLNTGNAGQKISVIKHLVDPFNKSLTSSEADTYLAKISGLKQKFSEDKKITALLGYVSGVLYDSKGLADRSREELQLSITLSNPNDLTYYLSNIRLGDVERRQNRFVETEKYFSAGISRYSRSFKTENFKERLLWLVSYYEKSGEKSQYAGNYKEAAGTYDKLINLLTLMYNKKLFQEVYSEFAPKAHIRYIDAYTAWKGEASISDLEKSYGKRENLLVLRGDFNRAALYGLAYIYTKKGIYLNSTENEKGGNTPGAEVYESFKKADEQLDWALFLDDTFIEPYILKSWIYQYVDLDRNTFGDEAEKNAGKYFPKHLWEENIAILEKALNANDERVKPENEGNLHLNMANNYFLLTNYPRALNSYIQAEKYKKVFGSDIEKALFHFHLGYSLWQNNEVKAAGIEIKKAYEIYNALSAGMGTEKFKYQYLTIYRYFALFSRYEKNYPEAISWYKKIMKYAEDNKLAIDRARYLQEIAYCYLKTGGIESARSYLDRAATALEKYPDDEKKYYLKIKLFGIIPVFSWDMGSDSVVIGDNRIFYPLDTQNKKLLNISMLEEIAVAENNFPEAIKILKEKVSILEESSTSVSVDARIRSLNNLGYYYCVSGKYADAEKFFNQAGDLAEKKGNLQGTFSSMMNLVNLYSLVIEKDRNMEIPWTVKINSLIKKIEKYRNTYYDMRFAEERDSLERKADAKDEKVTDLQIAGIRDKVEQETSSRYNSLDISAAILKYYLADILYISDPEASGKKGSGPAGLYSSNREIYDLYKNAAATFETAIAAADKSGEIEKKVKLSLNAASCYEKTGENERAYVLLLDAKNLSEKYYLSWVKIDACHKLGNFLYLHGRETGESDSLSAADRYFSSAISAIEEYPAIYSSHPGRIRMIYRDYMDFLIEHGNGTKAFEMAERYAQAARIISVKSLTPEFSNEYDRKKYYDYCSGLEKLASLRSELSSLLISGAEPLSPAAVSMKKNISAEEEKLDSVLKSIRTGNVQIRPYVEMTGYKTPALNNDLYLLHETGKGLYYWQFSKGRLNSGYVNGNAGSLFSGNADTPVFILLSDTVIDLINRGDLKASGNFIFINTLDRIPDCLKDSNSITKNIYSEEKGLRGVLSDRIDITDGGNSSFGNYSLIVDRSGTGNDITPETFFSSSISPACLIQTGMKADYRYLTSMMEGGFYTGTKRIIATSGTGAGAVFPIVKSLYGEKETLPGQPFFILGYINTMKENYAPDSKEKQERELSLFNGYMKKADFTNAGVHLSRWNSMQKEKNSAVYIKNLWLMDILSGRIQEARAVLDSYSPADENEKSAINLRKAYTFFYSGDLKNAEREIMNINESSGTETDLKFMKAVMKIFRNGDLSALDIIYGIKKPYSTIIPAERYIMPVTGYLFLAKDERAVKAAWLMPDQPVLSESEHLMRNIIGGVKPPSGRSLRFDRIADLWYAGDLSAQRDEALKLLRGVKGYDPLSVYPVLETVLRHEGRNLNDELTQFGNSVNLKRITSKSDNIPSLLLLKKTDDFYYETGNYRDRISVLNEILNITSKCSFDSIRKETLFDMAVNYFLMQDYQNSYDTAVSADKITADDDKSFIDLQLLLMDLYIKSGDYKDAGVKGALLGKKENLSPDRKFMLNLQLTMLELNRLRSLKKASITDAAEFEKLFSNVLSLCRHDTELLNRKGYREITGQVFDEFINYKMRTGQHTDAHYYNEVKKVLIASSRCGRNLFKYAGVIDMDAVQQVLPDNGLYVNIAKNRNDFFVWTADKKNKRAFIIDNGFAAFGKVADKYASLILSGGNMDSVSKEMQKIISPLYNIMKDKKVILISSDSDSEKIPFETIGSGELLSDRSLLVYIPSLLISTSGSSLISREVYFPEQDNSASAYVGRIAVRESGIKHTLKPGSDRGFVHLFSKIRYNQGGHEFLAGGKNIKSTVNKNAVLFAPSDEIKTSGVSDFLLSGRELNLQAALMNGSLIQDTNNALFMEEFYGSINKGGSLLNSFGSALSKLKSNSNYSSPSNWAGYRLNLYNLNLLKE